MLWEAASCGLNDFVTLHPKLASELHPSKNGDLMPEQFLPTSTTKVWWAGKECGHEWEISFTSRAKGSDCPYCTNRILLVGFNDLATANPSLASEWHPTKNGDLAPENVTTRASSRVWWLCPENHSWGSFQLAVGMTEGAVLFVNIQNLMIKNFCGNK